MSQIREPISSGISSFAVSAITRLVQRYYINLDNPVSASYYSLSTPWTATGDFEVSMLVSGGADTYGRLAANKAGYDNEIRLNNDNASINIKFSGGTGKRINLDSAIDRTKLHAIEVAREGGVVSVIVNGTTQADTVTDTGALVIDTIGRADAAYNVGILANPKLRDLSTSNNNLTFRLDNETSNTEVSNGVTLTYVNIVPADRAQYTKDANGDWLSVLSVWDGTPTIGTQWTDNGANNYSYIGDGSFNELSDLVLTVGESYIVDITVDSISGVMKAFGGAPKVAFSTVGAHKLLLENVETTTLGFARDSGVVSCTMTVNSVKRILEVAP